LAGLALDDATRTREAVRALAGCVRDPAQVGALTGISLCHGISGLIQVIVRASADSPESGLANSLPGLAEKLTEHPGIGRGYRPAAQVSPESAGRALGLLEGAAGAALALQSAADQVADPRWDGCLLIA